MLQRSSRPPAGGRGSTFIQAVVVMIVLAAMASLAVDVGLFLTAKLELQRAADAAALAGAAEIARGGLPADAVREAVRFAQANAVAGATLGRDAIDAVCVGRVDGRWVDDALPVRAVRVSLHRSRGRGNAVDLAFARVLGLSSADAHADATARVRRPTPAYNLAGVERATFGSLGVLARVTGRIVGNNEVSVGKPLGLFVGVSGDARSYAQAVQKGVLAGISGSTARLPEPLEYEPVTLPAHNDNAKAAAYLAADGDFNVVGVASVPAGTYVVRDLNLLAGAAVDLQGPVTFYVSGDFNLGVAVNLLGRNNPDPAAFKVRVLPGGTVNFLAPVLVPLNMDLYAPDSDIRIGVSVNAFKGRLVGRTLDVLLPAAGTFTEDRTLGDALADLPAVTLAAPATP